MERKWSVGSVQGYSEQPACVIRGTGKPGVNMPITFDRCGVRRARQVQPTGIGVSTVVIVSFHPIFLTKVDRAYRVNCFYMEATKTVEQELFVSMLTTQTIAEQLPMPLCRYEILRGDFKQGNPIRFAQVRAHFTPVVILPLRIHSCLNVWV